MLRKIISENLRKRKGPYKILISKAPEIKNFKAFSPIFFNCINYVLKHLINAHYQIRNVSTFSKKKIQNFIFVRKINETFDIVFKVKHLIKVK